MFAGAQFATSNYVSVQLADVIASLASAAAVVDFLRVWRPSEPLLGQSAAGARPAVAGAETYDRELELEVHRRERTTGDSPAEVVQAYAPYAVIIVIFALAQVGPIKAFLGSVTVKGSWPGLDVLTAKGKPPNAATFEFDWLQAAGTPMLISGLLMIPLLKVGVGRAVRTFVETLDQLKWATLTVAAVLALAYVMNFSGQTITLRRWVAGAGGAFAFLSPLIGWLGVAVTGSDTSSNSLFGALQVSAATKAHLTPVLLAAANSSGGVLVKMVSPQNLAIGAAAVGMAGEEGELFRRVIGWSLFLVLLMCVIVYLQSIGVLHWMVV